LLTNEKKIPYFWVRVNKALPEVIDYSQLVSRMLTYFLCQKIVY
jgi:ribosomal protein L7Ae-like RNA K-turn-binding protein